MSETEKTPEAAVTRESIFAGGVEPQFSWVLVEQWGGRIKVFSMTSAERDAFDRETIKRRKKSADNVRLRERLLIATVCDANGKKLFTAADENALSGMPSKILERPFRAAMRTNGFIEDEDDDAGN